LTPTISYTPTITFTPTNTPVYADIFYVDHNYFNPAQGPVSIEIDSTLFPGNYSLMIYNSAGEKVRTLASARYQNGAVFEWYAWDGRNDYGEMCASGVYIIFEIESFEHKMKKVLLVK
jgi:flagellar hook assembly protein FlgD